MFTNEYMFYFSTIETDFIEGFRSLTVLNAPKPYNELNELLKIYRKLNDRFESPHGPSSGSGSSHLMHGYARRGKGPE